MNILFSVEGVVEKGKDRGKRLGFPTANFKIGENLPSGIYVSQTEVNGRIFPSITFIGVAQTFNESDFTCETYIFDFNDEIYEKKIKVNILKKIRDNMKFDSEDELIEQMEKDKQEALKFFTKSV